MLRRTSKDETLRSGRAFRAVVAVRWTGGGIGYELSKP